MTLLTPWILVLMAVQETEATPQEDLGSIAQALAREGPLLQWLVRPPREDEPPARTQYMGREIARTMHWSGAQWLWRETREKQENVKALLDQLRLQPGMTVCDFGVGSGYHALPMARSIGPNGVVLAVDIQFRMLEMLQEKATASGVSNIVRVLSQSHTAFLEPKSCDVILMVDVYHEVSHPQAILLHLRDALKEDGVIALVEFRKEDPEVPIKRRHKMSKAQIKKEFTANGLRLVREYDDLPWQHLQFFGRDESWKPSQSSAPEEGNGKGP